MPRQPKAQNAKSQETAQNPKERRESGPVPIRKRHPDVHSKQARHHIERDNDGREQSHLAQHTVGVCPLGNTINRDLSEIIAVRARQHLFAVAEVVHHGDNVILDIAKVHAYVHTWRDLVVLVAPLGEASEDVGLAAK